MDCRENQIVLVEIRCAREIARHRRGIERELRKKLIARGELLGEPLELNEIAEAHVRGIVNALEMRLEPFTRPRDLSLPGTLSHRKTNHQFSKRVPRVCPPARLRRFDETRSVNVPQDHPRKPGFFES